MITEKDLQELLAFDPPDGSVVSLYLNVDRGQQTADMVRKQARSMLKNISVGEKDTKAIEDYLDYSFDWVKPGLAIFSCSSEDFFRAFQVSVSFRNRARLSKKPYIKPLTHLLDYYAHYGVIVVDRVGARFFEYHLGELEETAGTMGDDVRKLKLGGGSTRGGGTSSATGQRGGQGGRHEEEVIQRNMRDTADAAAEFFASSPIRRLFIGGTAENVALLRDNLTKQLQSRIAGTFPIDMSAGEHEVRERSLELLRQANLEREQKIVNQMITTAAKGGQAVLGLDATLRTISEGRVQTLVISDGYHSSGFVDENGAFLSAYEGNEATYGSEMVKMDDIVEVAVSRTMEQGGTVEVISDSEDLDRAGRIGALLRY